MQGVGCRIQDAGCTIQDAGCIPRVRVFRRQVPGTGYPVPGTWHLGPGTRYRIDAEGRTPSTEDRARLPENAHIGYANPMGAFPGSVLGARDPALGHGGMRGEGDTALPHASSRSRAEDRRSDTESGARHPEPGTGYLSSKSASTGFPPLPHYSVPSSLRSCRTASFPSNSAAPAGEAGRVKGEALSPRPVILLNYPALNTWVLRL